MCYISYQGEPGPVGPQGIAGDPGVGLVGPKVIICLTQSTLEKCSLIRFNFKTSMFLHYFLGRQRTTWAGGTTRVTWRRLPWASGVFMHT